MLITVVAGKASATMRYSAAASSSSVAEVASSRNSQSGLINRARAIASRCCSPSDSPAPKCASSSKRWLKADNPTEANAARASASRPKVGRAGNHSASRKVPIGIQGRCALRDRLQLAADLVPGKDLEYRGLDGALLTHCRLRR